ncbi:hypothetical protein FH972_026032 [Carpinus fangiana]|uniref:SET domain-containing protein n=1 Tax=Carpinus fangiana TaxID=176857 RepID=A0A5N6L2R4_9ROSI|nr:hypothetical protein FH972_026032 [Carpinus fangiana]
MVEQMQTREAVGWEQPSHPTLIQVEHGKEGSFGTRATSLASRPAGALFCDLSAARKASKRTYATVQASETSDIDLNSDVVYFNHSCNPSMVIDPAKMEVRVGDKPIQKGDELTLFYPSFEWSMSQPFDCTCSEKDCIGLIQGAKSIEPNVLQRYWLTDHVKKLSGVVNVNGSNGINGH